MRWLVRVPGWVFSSVEGAGIVVLAVLSWLSKGWSGTPSVIVLALVAAVTLVGFVVTRAQTWSHSRFRVALELDSPAEAYVLDLDSDPAVTAWLDDREEQLLQPLRHAQAKARRRAPSSPLLQAIADTQPSVSYYASLIGHRAESRSAAEFEAEVKEYRASLHNSLVYTLVYNHIASNRAALIMRPVNATDRTFKDVRFVLRVPGRFIVIDPHDFPKPKKLPSPPRTYGTSEYLDVSSVRVERIRMYEPLELPSDISVERTKSGITTITYPPVTLRARDSDAALAPIHLAVKAADDDGLTVFEWEATAENADGVVKGSFNIPVSAQPLPAAELLGDILTGLPGQSTD